MVRVDVPLRPLPIAAPHPEGYKHIAAPVYSAPCELASCLRFLRGWRSERGSCSWPSPPARLLRALWLLTSSADSALPHGPRATSPLHDSPTRRRRCLRRLPPLQGRRAQRPRVCVPRPSAPLLHAHLAVAHHAAGQPAAWLARLWLVLQVCRAQAAAVRRPLVFDGHS